MDPVLEYAARIAYSTRDTLQFTYEMAVRYKDSPGVYVECGVAAGAQLIAMAHGAPKKHIYGFDSFQGLPLPSNRDDQMPGIRKLSLEEISLLPDPGKQDLISTGAVAVLFESCYNNLLDSGIESLSNINLVRGWFEETVIGFNEPISILRLDGDLYNSTFVCLVHLYPMVLKGGIVIIDDWELPGCRSALKDYFDGRDENEPEYQFISNIAYFLKP